MSLSASEQYLLELINRARLDPEAEAKRYGVDLNDGLSSGQIGTDSLQVLAPNAKLAAAAESHSEWMLSSNAFSHAGAASSNAGDRAQSAGYTFNGAWAWRENLAWVGSTGDVNLEKAILEHHEGLYRSESHRVNIFGANVREIGVAQVAGNFTHQGTTYNSSMLTEVFAKSGTDVFVTGVAYRDTDRDNFYSIGEGQSGIRVWTGVTAATTTSAGGYSVSGSSQDAVSLTVSDGDSVLGHLRVNTSDGNVKLDVVTDRYGNLFYDLSGSATLQDGILEGRLLGLDDLSLSATIRWMVAGAMIGFGVRRAMMCCQVPAGATSCAAGKVKISCRAIVAATSFTVIAAMMSCLAVMARTNCRAIVVTTCCMVARAMTSCAAVAVQMSFMAATGMTSCSAAAAMIGSTAAATTM